MATDKRFGRFGDFNNDPTKRNDNFGDLTTTNRLASQGSNLRDRSSNRTNVISRQQAGAGSAGTTLGDNSGTGINTPTTSSKRRRKVTVIGTPGGERLGAKFRNNPNNQIRSLTESLRSDVNNGRISARAAAGIQADLIENLNTNATSTNSANLRANSARELLDFNKTNAHEDRAVRSSLAQLKESGAERRSLRSDDASLTRFLAGEANAERRSLRSDDASLTRFLAGEEGKNSRSAASNALTAEQLRLQEARDVLGQKNIVDNRAAGAAQLQQEGAQAARDESASQTDQLLALYGDPDIQDPKIRDQIAQRILRLGGPVDTQLPESDIGPTPEEIQVERFRAEERRAVTFKGTAPLTKAQLDKAKAAQKKRDELIKLGQG